MTKHMNLSHLHALIELQCELGDDLALLGHANDSSFTDHIETKGSLGSQTDTRSRVRTNSHFCRHRLRGACSRALAPRDQGACRPAPLACQELQGGPAAAAQVK